MFDKLLGKGKAAQVTESLWAMNSKQQTTMLVTTQPATSVAQQKRQLSPLDPTGEPKPRQRVLGDFCATLPALNPVRLPPSDGASVALLQRSGAPTDPGSVVAPPSTISGRRKARGYC
jgi:hypothetical protein